MGDERRVVRTEDVLDHRYLTLRLVTERDAEERDFTYVWGTGPDIVYCVPLFEDGLAGVLCYSREEAVDDSGAVTTDYGQGEMVHGFLLL